MCWNHRGGGKRHAGTAQGDAVGRQGARRDTSIPHAATPPRRRRTVDGNHGIHEDIRLANCGGRTSDHICGPRSLGLVTTRTMQLGRMVPVLMLAVQLGIVPAGGAGDGVSCDCAHGRGGVSGQARGGEQSACGRTSALLGFVCWLAGCNMCMCAIKSPRMQSRVRTLKRLRAIGRHAHANANLAAAESAFAPPSYSTSAKLPGRPMCARLGRGQRLLGIACEAHTPHHVNAMACSIAPGRHAHP